MSGINELKQKTKLSIDEMYDSKQVGNMEIQFGENPEKQKENKKPKHRSNQAVVSTTSNMVNHHPVQPQTQPAEQAAHESHQSEAQIDMKFDPVANKPQTGFLSQKQPAQQTPTFKMTFSLTFEVYKSFNDLYARRMLEGRKTDKSEMICEAIQWLIKMEEKKT